MASGLVGWQIAPVLIRAASTVQPEQVQGWALLLVGAALAARAVPGVRWVAGIAGVIGVAATTVAAYALDEAIRLGWAAVAGHTQAQPALPAMMLLRLATALAAGLVATALLRSSAGGVLLPGVPVRRLAEVAWRVVAVAAAGVLGFSLFFSAFYAEQVVGATASTRSLVEQGLRVTLPDLVASIVVLAAVHRPARLPIPDAAFLGAAGLVAYPLYVLAMAVVRGALPSGPLIGLTLASVAVGVGLAVWWVRSNRRVDAARLVSVD